MQVQVILVGNQTMNNDAQFRKRENSSVRWRGGGS